MSATSRYYLLRALVLSLAIHAVLLVGVFRELPVRLPDTPPAAVSVMLNTDSMPAHGSSGSEKALVKKAVPAPPEPRPHSRMLVASKPVPVLLPSPAVRDLTPAAAALSVAGEPSAAEASASTASQGNATDAPRDELNADDMRQYRVSLAVAARRFKRYPAIARERGWEGVSEISLAVSSHQGGAVVGIVRSSGHAVLDQQAREMLVQAARTAVLPESLKGRDFRIVFPVHFNLDADQ